MYIVRISDTKCVVTNGVKGDWEYEFIYTDFANGSIEALEQAERQCGKMNKERV